MKDEGRLQGISPTMTGDVQRLGKSSPNRLSELRIEPRAVLYYSGKLLALDGAKAVTKEGMDIPDKLGGYLSEFYFQRHIGYSELFCGSFDGLKTVQFSR